MGKLIVNCNVGESGDKLTKASRVVEQLTGQQPIYGRARYTIRSFGIRRNEKISCCNDTGCFGFGITEHIDLGMKYDPSTGIFGMNFFIVLRRAGGRVAMRKRKRGRIGTHQKVTRDDAMKFFRDKYEGIIIYPEDDE